MMKDERNDDQKPVEHKLDQRTQGKEGKGMMFRKTFTFLFPVNAAGADRIQEQEAGCNGEIIHICEADALGTGRIMTQITILDDHGLPVWDGEWDYSNPRHYEFAQARRLLLEKDVIRCTVADDPGGDGLRVDVVVSLLG